MTGAVRGRSSEGEGVAGSRLGSSTGRKAAAARKTEQPPPAVDLLLDLQVGGGRGGERREGRGGEGGEGRGGEGGREGVSE